MASTNGGVQVTRVVQATGAALMVLLFLAAAGLAAELSGRITQVGDLTRDPTAIAGVPWWTGAVSRITNLCWAAAAAFNLLAAQATSPPHRRPLRLLGGLCAVLAVDDTMLVHESILRGRGVHENALVLVYAVAGLVLAWLWWTTSWRRTVVGAFFVGAAALGFSVAADLLHTELLLLEDGAKLVGIIAWCLCGVWAHSDALTAIRGQRTA